MWIVFLFLAICIIGEDNILRFIGGCLGAGYGIIMIIAFVGIIYGIYAWLSGK